MMLLDEVDTQNEWFVQIGYDIKLVCESFVSNLEVESIETSHWQGLSPCQLKLWLLVIVNLFQPRILR